MTLQPDPDYCWHNKPVDPALDPATRVIDAQGRIWATTPNGTWGAIGHDVTADNYTQLEAKYGVEAVLA